MSYKKIFTAFLVIPFLLPGCKEDKQMPTQEAPKVNVSVAQVRPQLLPYFEEYAGLIKALQEVELRAQVSGYISGIYFNDGDRVRKGQKLYSIDSQPFQAAYQQAQANLLAQEANLAKAEKDVFRYRELAKKDAVAIQALDNAEATFATAQQEVAAARAAVDNVQTNVKYATISAPFDGTIGISLVRTGASISMGQTLLNTISTDNPIAIEVAIDQSQLLFFSEIKAAGGGRTDSLFQLKIDGITYPQFGRLSFIDRAVDPLTGTIKVRVEFPNPDFIIRPGMTATLVVRFNSKEAVVAIPFKAVTEQLGEFFVYVSDGTKVSQRQVKLGRQLGRQIVVLEGLTGDEIIVTEGVQNLREGALINIPSDTPGNK
ncbi:MAG: efflux RND transporter periplasmic adaptor subunit [Saprospiraceae bacterium]|nr:efflux RND transporter periplasmic adaptor subunit [Saprospiraceae bacterium]